MAVVVEVVVVVVVLMMVVIGVVIMMEADLGTGTLNFVLAQRKWQCVPHTTHCRKW